MKKTLKRALPLLLSAVMTVSMVGCGDGNSGSNSATAGTSPGSTAASTVSTDTSASIIDHTEEYNIDVFSQRSNFAGEQGGWFAKILKDKFNMKLNIIASNIDGGAGKFATLMAAGNLGDLVIFGSDGQDFKNAIKGNLILDWNKNGLLDKYGKDIIKYAPMSIEKSKTKYGNGTAVYASSGFVGSNDGGPADGAALNYGPYMRWDLYKKLGSPEMNTMEDLLNVLKKMQELEPKNAAGKPAYAFSMWSDWDGGEKMNSAAWNASFINGGIVQYWHTLEITTNTAKDILDETGGYMQQLKVLYKANQMGLVDPDSLTQKYTDAQNKYKDGRVLFSYFSWLGKPEYNTTENVSNGKGFMLVPLKTEKCYAQGMNPYGNSDALWSIGSKSEHPERIMEVINWLYSPDGVMTLWNGPKGLTWDIKDGKPYVTDFGMKAFENRADTDVPAEFGGGKYEDGVCKLEVSTLNYNSINPETDEPYMYSLWPSYLKVKTDPVLEDWRKAMGGVLTDKEYLVKNNMVAVAPSDYIPGEKKVLDSKLDQKRVQVGQVIQQNSWKMVFAKNDAEFESLKNDMIKKAKGLGYDELVKWYMDNELKPYMDKIAKGEK